MAELMMNVSPEFTDYWDKPADDNKSQIIKMPSILESIKQMVSTSASITYAKGCDTNSKDTTGFAEAVKAARASDVAVLVMGDRSGLAWECSTGEFRDAADLHLPGVQESLVKTILETGKPVVLVLVNGRPTAITDLVEKTNAILEAWVPGEEGGKAVAGCCLGRSILR